MKSSTFCLVSILAETRVAVELTSQPKRSRRVSSSRTRLPRRITTSSSDLSATCVSHGRRNGVGISSRYITVGGLVDGYKGVRDFKIHIYVIELVVPQYAE